MHPHICMYKCTSCSHGFWWEVQSDSYLCCSIVKSSAYAPASVIILFLVVLNMIFLGEIVFYLHLLCLVFSGLLNLILCMSLILKSSWPIIVLNIYPSAVLSIFLLPLFQLWKDLLMMSQSSWMLLLFLVLVFLFAIQFGKFLLTSIWDFFFWSVLIMLRPSKILFITMFLISSIYFCILDFLFLWFHHIFALVCGPFFPLYPLTHEIRHCKFPVWWFQRLFHICVWFWYFHCFLILYFYLPFGMRHVFCCCHFCFNWKPDMLSGNRNWDKLA